MVFVFGAPKLSNKTNNRGLVMQHPDFIEMQKALGHVEALQSIANRHGVHDVFQDNGGKILQIILALDLKVLPGRTGNDAVDGENNQYELKATASRWSGGFSTNHHLNHKTIEKFRRTSWVFAFFKGIRMTEVYKMVPVEMESIFKKWEEELQGKDHLNNPKIPVSFVRDYGKQIWFANKFYKVSQQTFWDFASHLAEQVS